MVQVIINKHVQKNVFMTVIALILSIYHQLVEVQNNATRIILITIVKFKVLYQDQIYTESITIVSQ